MDDEKTTTVKALIDMTREYLFEGMSVSKKVIIPKGTMGTLISSVDGEGVCSVDWNDPVGALYFVDGVDIETVKEVA
jgi:hypothetical protein